MVIDFFYFFYFFSLLQQTKRKLEDACKRLENLYDKLRDQTVRLSLTSLFAQLRDSVYNTDLFFTHQLSPSILAGLHEIARCVAARNYPQGLEVHTQVVSSSNFSEISAFMPVLKMLMTIANKLAV